MIKNREINQTQPLKIMRHESEKHTSYSKDVRVAATSRIWGIAAGMLAICIPLSDETDSGAILPLAVIAGAAVGTVAVWKSDQKSQTTLPPYQVQQIEQRLANLETIISADDLDLRLKTHQLEPQDRSSQS
jgi:hypothetical protein